MAWAVKNWLCYPLSKQNEKPSSNHCHCYTFTVPCVSSMQSKIKVKNQVQFSAWRTRLRLQLFFLWSWPKKPSKTCLTLTPNHYQVSSGLNFRNAWKLPTFAIRHANCQPFAIRHANLTQWQQHFFPMTTLKLSAWKPWPWHLEHW